LPSHFAVHVFAVNPPELSAIVIMRSGQPMIPDVYFALFMVKAARKTTLNTTAIRYTLNGISLS